MFLIKAMLFFCFKINKNSKPNKNQENDLSIDIKKLNWRNVKFGIISVVIRNAKKFYTSIV